MKYEDIKTIQNNNNSNFNNVKMINKKIYLVGKIRSINPTNLSTVQKNIQNDIDKLTTVHKVNFGIDILSNNEICLLFNRTTLNSLVKKDSIYIDDVFLITGKWNTNFCIPEIIPVLHFINYINIYIDKTDFIDIYMKSAKKLKLSKITGIDIEVTLNVIKMKIKF